MTSAQHSNLCFAKPSWVGLPMVGRPPPLTVELSPDHAQHRLLCQALHSPLAHLHHIPSCTSGEHLCDCWLLRTELMLRVAGSVDTCPRSSLCLSFLLCAETHHALTPLRTLSIFHCRLPGSLTGSMTPGVEESEPLADRSLKSKNSGSRMAVDSSALL